MSGVLIGVGVGPGDPEHLTLKALHALQAADRVFVPETDSGETPGRAERVVAPHVDPQRITRLLFAMRDDDARSGNWDRAGAAIAEVVAAGGTAAFATIGDPNIYSTFTYMAHTVRELVPDVEVRTVPGITAMQDLASRSGTVLAEGREALALLPYTAGDDKLRETLGVADTVVVYKGGRRLPQVLETLRDHDRLDEAVYGEQLGLGDQDVRAAGERDGSGPYMSTVIVPANRDGVRGGKL
ncbi:precorrin-2 C(20)-methyltransferase [Conexibacter sp. SYSU D00693]|uniref:precorrin-2 C(20)-methyltransferase n=1 Tax=Conexibacter sp. SYSU D00693 TaxID=2812560 RepID=UPI00196B90A8|nr:precorrin-2 C(20)-methyltransferase [Conexibacter sp. SYSU D00693]